MLHKHQHESHVSEFTEGLEESGIPPHLIGGLVRYVKLGVMPGRFLQAVLENDLSGALTRADQASMGGLGSIILYLNSNLSADAWGSAEKVQAWIGAIQSWSKTGGESHPTRLE
jgi:hypothetical protein